MSEITPIRSLPDCSTHRVFGRGLDHLQHHLDLNEMPADWPDNVCRDAWCGRWERSEGVYFWHLAHSGSSPEVGA